MLFKPLSSDDTSIKRLTKKNTSNSSISTLSALDAIVRNGIRDFSGVFKPTVSHYVPVWQFDQPVWMTRINWKKYKSLYLKKWQVCLFGMIKVCLLKTGNLKHMIPFEYHPTHLFWDKQSLVKLDIFSPKLWLGSRKTIILQIALKSHKKEPKTGKEKEKMSCFSFWVYHSWHTQKP